ncbi:MAG: hypothetical protein ACI30X_07180 [Muribaculaceae bacterium]
MQALFDHRPQVLEAYGNDIYRYRYDIEDITTEEGVQFSAQEVKIYAPISANKITAAVIADRWDNNFEQKLVNEYNAAKLGIYSEEEAQAKIKAYAEFLAARSALKLQVDEDCAALGIL